MREDKKLLHAVEQCAGTDQDVSYNVSLCLPFSNKEQQQLLQFVGFFSDAPGAQNTDREHHR